MKKSLLLLLLLAATALNAQVINIPDANFKARLLSTSSDSWLAIDINGNYLDVDGNNDGEIDQAEALLVRELKFYYGGWGYPIQSLEGIQYFTNIEILDVGSNHITALDVTALTNLRELNCRYNGLVNLNVNGLSNLKRINFEFNPLSSFAPAGLTSLEDIQGRFCNLQSLDLSIFPALKTINCSNNNLSTLDATAAPLLINLSCENNIITALNISGLSLQSLNCSNNTLPGLNVSEFTGLAYLALDNIGISSLDLTGFTQLEVLNCSSNPITVLNTEDLSALSYISINNSLISSLDLSHSPNIVYFSASNNPLMTNINLHNGTLIQYGAECSIINNPNLQYICIDEGEEEELLLSFESDNQPAPYMSTDCTFDPTQVYNSFTGNVKLDVDVNGCDANDPVLKYLKLVITDGTNTTIRFTDNNGDYLKYVGAGNYSLTPQYTNPYFASLPLQAAATFPGMDGTVHEQDFCITADGVHPDAEVYIVPGGAVPGFNAHYTVVIKNKGSKILSGTYTLAYNDDVLDFVSSESPVVSNNAGVITWEYNNLLPFETRYQDVEFTLNSPSDTPPVNIDDILAFTANITTGADTDEAPVDNTFEMNQVVVSAFDPNNILCMQGETVSPEKIGDYLHYIINFENTGNADASFIVVTQQIDTNKYDINSLEVLSATHNVAASISGDMVEYRFDNINLAPAATGNVVYKIKSKQSLAAGDYVASKASIVFDYNLPIVTNQAVTTFAVLSNQDFEKGVAVKVYPNPTSGIINVVSNSNIHTLELYDIQGRLLQSNSSSEASAILNLSARAAGMYLLKIITEEGTTLEKIIKE